MSNGKLDNTFVDNTWVESVATNVVSTQRNVVNGIAGLDASGKILVSQLPATAITDTYAVSTITARDALTVQEGDVAIVTNSGDGEPRSYIYNGSAWLELKNPSAAVAAQSSISTHETTYNHTILVNHVNTTTGNPHNLNAADVGAAAASHPHTEYAATIHGTHVPSGGTSSNYLKGNNTWGAISSLGGGLNGWKYFKPTGLTVGDNVGNVVTHDIGTFTTTGNTLVDVDFDVTLYNIYEPGGGDPSTTYSSSVYIEILRNGQVIKSLDSNSKTVHSISKKSFEVIPAGTYTYSLRCRTDSVYSGYTRVNSVSAILEVLF